MSRILKVCCYHRLVCLWNCLHYMYVYLLSAVFFFFFFDDFLILGLWSEVEDTMLSHIRVDF